jgi:hypothetical protein
MEKNDLEKKLNHLAKCLREDQNAPAVLKKNSAKKFRYECPMGY